MTATIKRLGLAAAATAIAVSLAGGAYAASQDNSGQGPGPGGRPGRFGGPGGPGGPGRGGGPGGRLPLMALGRLDLTDAQKEQVKTIFESHKDEIKAIGDRARAAHLALDAALTGTTAAVDADAAVAQARSFNEVYQILTTEQQAKLKEVQANRQKRMASGPRGRGPGPR
jgi:Spy/CpxP family protein refolding chaperone